MYMTLHNPYHSPLGTGTHKGVSLHISLLADCRLISCFRTFFEYEYRFAEYEYDYNIIFIHYLPVTINSLFYSLFPITYFPPNILRFGTLCSSLVFCHSSLPAGKGNY